MHNSIQTELESQLAYLKSQYSIKIKELDTLNNEIIKIEQELNIVQQQRHHELELRKQEDKLLDFFKIGYFQFSDRPNLIPILIKLKENQRLTPEEVVWLETSGKENYFKKKQKTYLTYHRIEAEYYLSLYHQNKSVWHLVNASSHFRKADLSNKIHDILESKNIKINQNDKKLHSAFLTTLGGVKRDLGFFTDGIKMAQEAHEYVPQDYRPCTLLGALYFEINQYDIGTKWFDKAEELGAPQHDTDAEIRAIYHKANKAEKEQLKAYLLQLNPIRYAWLKKSQS